MLASVSSQTLIQKQVWRMDEQTDGWGGGDWWPNKRIVRQMDRWTNGWLDKWMGEWMDGWIGIFTHGCQSAFLSCLKLIFQMCDVCWCGHMCAYIHSQQLFLWLHACICVSCVQQTGYLAGVCLRWKDDTYSEWQIRFLLGPSRLPAPGV